MKKYSLCILLCLTCSIVSYQIDPAKLDDKLSIYTYPEDDSKFPTNFYNGLVNQPIIPKEILVKMIDIVDKDTIKEKTYLFDVMKSKFDSKLFNLIWLINAPHDLNGLNISLVQSILDMIKSLLKTYPKPKHITIDVEPIYNIKTKFNMLPFHSKLIKGINSMGISASPYINPSVYSNPDVDFDKIDGNSDFIKAMKANPNNIVYLPAYYGGEEDIRTDRILQSVKYFSQLKIKYKLIVDFENKTKLAERLKFIKDNKLTPNGLAIYRLSKAFPEPPSGTMDLIKDCLKKQNKNLDYLE